MNDQRPNKCIEHNPRANSILFCGWFISLGALALATGMQLSHLSMIFSGKRNPTIKSGRIMAQALGMSFPAFLKALDERVETIRQYTPVPTPEVPVLSPK